MNQLVKQKEKLEEAASTPMLMLEADGYYMDIALEQAQKALAENEVPVGSVVVSNGEIIAIGRNAKETERDPTAHAEIIAIRQACKKLSRWRLSDCTIYSTMEPCPMCAGAMLSARLERLVFGCPDPKAGVAGSLYNLLHDMRLNHRLQVRGGVRKQDAANLLQVFFKEQRRKAKSLKCCDV